jgi:hypothetical protein
MATNNRTVVAVVTALVADIFSKTSDLMVLAVLADEAEVVILTIYNGRPQMRKRLYLKLNRVTIQASHKALRPIHRRHRMTAVKLLQRKRKIHLDHPRNYKWRTKGPTESAKLLKKHRVMINHLPDRLLQNSASPSSPKLLLRLQLNLPQISINLRDRSSLRRTDHQCSPLQDLKTRPSISSVETQRDKAIELRMTENSFLRTIADLPMKVLGNTKMIVDPTGRDLHLTREQRKRSNCRDRYCLPNLHNPTQYITESPVMSR